MALRSSDPFRLRSTILLIVITVSVLAGFRQFDAAGGVGLGFLLYAVNLFLIMEIGRSLLRRDNARHPKPLAAVSSAGRLLFLAIALSLSNLLKLLRISARSRSSLSSLEVSAFNSTKQP